MAKLPPPEKPLPAVRSLAAIPRGLHAHAECAKRLADGCEEYAGRYRLSGGMEAFAGRWLGMLRASGWLTKPLRCVPGRTGQHCRVYATRSFAPNDARPVLIVAAPHDTGHGAVEGAFHIFALG